MTAVLPERVLGGVYDIPEHEYHRDPVPGGSLSSSGARRILSACPAVFQWERQHGRAPRRAWDFGTAAHHMVLGTGPELAVVNAPDYRTKAAQLARDAARERGAVPLLPAEHQQVQEMATALRQHRVASALLDPDRGRPEQTLIWQDEQTGVWRRALVDWLPEQQPGRRLIVTDYKTTTNASPAAISRTVADYGYHQQGAWYCDGAAALGLDPDPAFLLIFQEKTAPFLVTVVQLDPAALATGRERNRRALEIYAACSSTGLWPGYADDIPLITLPAWATREDNL